MVHQLNSEEDLMVNGTSAARISGREPKRHTRGQVHVQN